MKDNGFVKETNNSKATRHKLWLRSGNNASRQKLEIDQVMAIVQLDTFKKN